MTTKEQLNDDLRQALRSGDGVRRDTLRLLLSSLHNAEIDAGKPLDEMGILTVIGREVKQRRESIEEYRKGARQDLVDRETAELNVLTGYLPAQLSRDEIVREAGRVIEQVGAHGPADKGKVMPVIMGELRGRADGREINEVVTELLAKL